MSNFSVLLFTSTDLMEMFEHYKRAFNAKLLWDGRGDAGELIHVQMDVLGNGIGLAPAAPHELAAGNVTVVCLKFRKEKELRRAYEVLCEGGHGEGLLKLPWSSLEGYVTDKYGVKWCIGV
ncbi:MAG: hypothetical protein FWC27_01950 [Firmicutes bacterium]|nr:hypothetical protein [Bacillota bacterium]